jgi:hypothetical protein
MQCGAACRSRTRRAPCAAPAPRAEAGRGFGRAKPAAAPAPKMRPSMPSLSMPSAPLEAPTPWHGSAALVEYITAAGGWVHPALVVGSVGGGERGVFVTEAVPRGPLAFVPLACCVTDADADTGPAAHLWATASELGDGGGVLCTAEAKLAAHLLLRATRAYSAPAPTPDADAEADADAYVASLPGRSFDALAGFPLTWRAEQRAALAHPALEASLSEARAEAVAQHAHLAATLPVAGFVPTLRDWLWARALVSSRAYATPADAGGARLALEPLLDCVNHAPFPESAFDASRSLTCRNSLHSYVPPGTTPAAAAAAGLSPALPAACGVSGAAALLALRPLRAGEQVRVSYRDATPGGRLTADESLSRYGFLPAAHADACHVIEEAHPDASSARDALAACVDAALAAGAPPEALLASALAAHARDVTAAAAADHAAAIRAEAAASSLLVSQFGDADAPAARLAALYRRGRRLALGRAALARLPREQLARGSGGALGLAAGVVAGVTAATDAGVFDACAPGTGDAFSEMALQALTAEEAPRLTPAEALALR